MALKNYATLVRIDQLSELPASSTHSQEIEAMIDERKAYLKGNPDDISSYAILAALHSWNSPSEAKLYTSSLPPISTFTKSVDVKQLEEQGIPSNVVTTQVKRATESRPRKRRIRGGKTFDPSNQVDPERWLPLRERSYYKPSKSKKKKAGGATQGGVESAEMSRNGSEVVEIKKPETATAKKKKKTRK
jgi:signal recognition particle subunit SRP72